MGQPPRGAPRGAPGTTTSDLAPLVAVRDIKPIDGALWAVRLRLRDGTVATMVISRQLATLETVVVAAHAAAVLIQTDRAGH